MTSAAIIRRLFSTSSSRVASSSDLNCAFWSAAMIIPIDAGFASFCMLKTSLSASSISGVVFANSQGG